MPATLLLEPIRERGFDAQLSLLERCRLTRSGSMTYVEIDRPIVDAVRLFALAGVRARECAEVPSPSPDLRAAIGLDLLPIDGGLDGIDAVEIRRIPLSETSAVLLRRSLGWRPVPPANRERCRRLLHGDDAVLGWRRIAWCPATALRAKAMRAHFRPVVFDRTGIDRAAVRWSYASENALARWAFA